MAINKKKYEPDLQTDRAKNIEGNVIYINDAESGRNGYYCLGCQKEMEAVIIRKNPNHRSYFRHIPVDVAKGEKPCIFSNRQYRENIASDILQRLKRIKVPRLYKYPHKGKDLYPMLLKDSHFIEAYKVRSQVVFYEDESGEVHYGKNPEIDDRYLIMRPDVVFFDEKDNPILFIELVITHKITDEKRIKLRRLGIDTVSVKVPKSSDVDIEEAFKHTQNTKWEYSEEESNTTYVPVTKGDSEGILEFDKYQRGIFNEVYKCRKNRIANTIRSITRSLATKSYRKLEQQFKSELRRIENATEREKQKLEELEKRYDQEVYSEIAGEYEAIEQQERELVKSEKEFQRKVKDLESRYVEKDWSLGKEEYRIESLIQEQIELGESEDKVEQQFREKEDKFQREFDLKRNRIEEDIRLEEILLREIRTEENTISEKFKQFEEQEEREFEQNKENEQRDFKQRSREIESKQREIDEKIIGFEEVINDARRELKERYESIRDQITEDIVQRNSSGTTELSKRIKAVLDVRRISSSYNERLKTYERYRTYLELARSGTWEKQHES